MATPKQIAFYVGTASASGWPVATATYKTLNAARARGMRHIRYLVILILTVGLSGCYFGSSRPIYPASWPSLSALDAGRTCPDLSGTYRAVSDEAASLVYPPGHAPQTKILFVPIEKLEPSPPLGLRILPWHLAGSLGEEKSDLWNALIHYSALLDIYTANFDHKDDAGWVRVQELPDALIEVDAGLHDQMLLHFALKKEAQGFWHYRSHIYECKNGGLVVFSGFIPPRIENPTGATNGVGARCTFFRAVDGSLVMLEAPYTGVQQGTMSYQKWWRWRRIE